MKTDEATEQFLIDQARRSNRPIPDFILNKPTLLPGLRVFYDAFLDLNADRINNVISWRSIAEYVTFYGFDQEQAEDLFYYVRAMEVAFNSNSK